MIYLVNLISEIDRYLPLLQYGAQIKYVLVRKDSFDSERGVSIFNNLLNLVR